MSLAEARGGRPSTVVIASTSGMQPPVPPPGTLDLIKYQSPVGNLWAYLTPDPRDARRHPAIVWITGGDSSSLDDVWTKEPANNDQTARAFREAGIVTMYPSLRGGNNNPGGHEGFYGEVDDILAAASFLAEKSYVDPSRIYLGGHSTGGTLVLLVAEYSPRFRATFSFGPVDDFSRYRDEYLPQNISPIDARLRSPIHWLPSVRSPVFVMEGAQWPSNRSALWAFRAAAKSPQVHVQLIPGATHFSDLAPATKMVASKIIADTGSVSHITISDGELKSLMGR